jgi:hypothetical protein
VDSVLEDRGRMPQAKHLGRDSLPSLSAPATSVKQTQWQTLLQREDRSLNSQPLP